MGESFDGPCLKLCACYDRVMTDTATLAVFNVWVVTQGGFFPLVPLMEVATGGESELVAAEPPVDRVQGELGGRILGGLMLVDFM